MLSPLEDSEERSTEITINLDDLPSGALYDHLMGAYISGVQEIVIRSIEPLKRKPRNEIRRFLRSTRGFEIGDEDDSHIRLISLLNVGELPLNASLNRMYLLLSSLVRDILETLQGADNDLISDHDEREREVDGLQYLIERQVGSMLSSSQIVKSLGISRKQGVEYANLARSLERMMDHADQTARLSLDSGLIPKLSIEKMPLSALPIWLDSIKTLMINLRERDAHQIENARNSLKSAQLELEKHEESLWSGKRKAAPLLFED